MAPSPCIDLCPSDAESLLRIARRSIDHGLGEGGALRVEDPDVTGALGNRHGVFVTLTLGGNLRGCIGSLRATAPLAQSVADAAYGAAFDDPRFPPLRGEEMSRLRIEVSILSDMAPIAVSCREELLHLLQPGCDGLLLEDGRHRSTFLPKVWEQLPSPGDFLDHLLAKAGLPMHYWSPSMRFFRYQTVSLSEP